MWNVLEINLVTAGSYFGREDILCQLRAGRPKDDDPLKANFTNLSNYRLQLDHTDNTISDHNFRTQLFTSLPSKYAVILMVLKHRKPLPTPEEAVHDLLEEKTTASHTKELRDASRWAVLLSQRGSYPGCGHGGCGGPNGPSGRGGHGGSGGAGDRHESKCIYCQMDSHTPDACREHIRTQEGGNNGSDERICFQCRLPGSVKDAWVSYQRFKEWWRVMKATATAALAMTGDCDPFWQNASALATAAAIAPKWVTESRTSHHMCDDRSIFSMSKKLSLLIIIEPGDNNSVIVMHYSFVNVIQGFQVEALQIPTFWNSFQSIYESYLGGHTTILLNGKSSITLPSCCTLPGQLINGIYIIVPST